MKTDDLITMLASGADALEQHALQRRYSLALGWSLSFTMLLMLILLGVRPDIAEAVHLIMFWMKQSILHHKCQFYYYQGLK